MKQYLFLFATLSILSVSTTYAQYSQNNEYGQVAEKILNAMLDRDFNTFRSSAERAGLTIRSKTGEHPFWTQMREHISNLSKSEGWEELATLQLTDKFFIASFIYYTKTPLYITLTFQEFENQWTLVSFNYKEDFSDFTREWGFMLNKRAPSSMPIKNTPSDLPVLLDDYAPRG